jgi:hypothetical protein
MMDNRLEAVMQPSFKVAAFAALKMSDTIRKYKNDRRRQASPLVPTTSASDALKMGTAVWVLLG